MDGFAFETFSNLKEFPIDRHCVRLKDGRREIQPTSIAIHKKKEVLTDCLAPAPKEVCELASGEDVDNEIPEFLVSWFAFSQ